jgi:hypothetical protein
MARHSHLPPAQRGDLASPASGGEDMRLQGVSWWAPVGSRRSSRVARATQVYSNMEQWSEIGRRVLVEELSKRAACRVYGLHLRTRAKMLEHSEPPG